MGIEFEPAIPILRFFDEGKAREFYLEYLGCTVQWEHRFDDQAPLYMEVQRGGLVLHLSEHHGDGVPGVAVLINVVGIVALHTELSAKPYRHLRPELETTPWDTRMMTLLDPFGNRLRLQEPL